MSKILMPSRRLIAPTDLRVRNGAIFAGMYRGQIWRKGRLIDQFDFPNLVLNQGLDHILGVEFASVSQITAWYLAPFEGNYTPVSTDTASSLPSNATEDTAYTASTRQAFTVTEASQQATNSASPAQFTFNATKTIYGAFLTSISTKLSTSGVAFSAAAFGASKSVVDGDVLNLTYTVGAASS